MSSEITIYRSPQGLPVDRYEDDAIALVAKVRLEAIAGPDEVEDGRLFHTYDETLVARVRDWPVELTEEERSAAEERIEADDEAYGAELAAEQDGRW